MTAAELTADGAPLAHVALHDQVMMQRHRDRQSRAAVRAARRGRP